MGLITLFLTCANKEEATKISQRLLKDKLVACVKSTAVQSSFIWEAQVENSQEVLLIIDSQEDKFEEIEKVVKELHSYKTFVLTAYPIVKASAGVETWVKESIV